jgi:hypothetical protein
MFWEQSDCFVRKEGCLCVCLCVCSVLLQVIGRLSTERHDSEHRGPAVRRLLSCELEARRQWVCLRWSEHREFSVRRFAGVGQQSTDRHDSEHRGPAVVASGAVSWNRGDDGVMFCVGLNQEIAVDFVDFAGGCTAIN